MTAAKARETRTNHCVHRLRKALDAQVAHALTAIGAETMHRDRIIGGLDRGRHDRGRLAFDVEDRPAAAVTVRGRLGQVQQQQDGEIAWSGRIALVDPGLADIAGAPLDRQGDRCVNVERVAVALALVSDTAADRRVAGQFRDPAHRLGVRRGIEGLRGNGGIGFQNRGPVRPLGTRRIVPLRVGRDRKPIQQRHRTGLRAQRLVRLGVVVGRLATRIVAPLDSDGIDGKFDRLGRTVRLVAEIPQRQIVVAIGGFDDVALGVELQPHLPDVVAEQATDLAADGRIGPTAGGSGKQRPPLGHPRVRILIIGIDQRPRQPHHQSGCGCLAGWRRAVKWQP
ncbi:hypothetical protein [Bradyrhizobium elkanii]